MNRILILYGTKEGQTGRIAESLKDQFQSSGHETDVINAKKLPQSFSLDGYKGVLIGSSVHMGLYSSAVRQFIRQNKSELEELPSAFFSVSLSDASSTSEERAQLDPYINKYLDKCGWHPATIGRFGGSLAYTKYGFFTRFLMKKIGQSKGQSTDTSKDYEYTNWDQVKAFGNEFLEQCNATSD